MKKSILLLFAALLPLVASAEKVEIDGIWYNLDESAKQAEVTYRGDNSWDGGEYSGSITLPATVTHNGVQYSVTSIGYIAFYCCSSLTAIKIPEGVTSIGRSAFANCSSLTAITIPEGVTSIEREAFSYCSSLTAITIPEGVTSIGERAFYNCSSLTAISVAEGNTIYDSRGGCNAIIETNSNTLISGCATTIIPESVTSIGDDAFHGCSSLTAITIPKSVTSIGDWAFHVCRSLTTITIPEGVTSIGEGAFRNCTSLTTITIPEGVTSIGTHAFEFCTSLTSITIPEGMTSIGEYAFSGCSSLTSITIPEGVTSIGNYAFQNCNSLTTINIPENSQLTSIGDYTFQYCRKLTAITIPEGMTSIGWSAFKNCSSLASITCHAATPPTIGDYYTLFGVNRNIPVYVPASAVEAYKAAAYWSEFTNIQSLTKSVTEITLNQTSAILTEGESITLTTTVNPEDATDPSVTWSSSDEDVAMVSSKGRVITLAPGTATITATANDGSGVSASCEVRVVLGKCDTPTISYEDGRFSLTCATEGVEIRTNVLTENDNEYVGAEFDYIPTHTFTAYATKENYEDSDVATLTLCWIPCTEEHESEETGILTIPSKPVLIGTQGGTITVSGLAAGTAVAVYSTAGTLLATATATDGTATLATNLEAGSIAIVKMGDYSIKVAIK